MAALDTTQTSADIGWALRQLRDTARLNGYRYAEAYYDGVHRLTFATNKFRSTFGGLFTAFADNLCPAVVDSVSDRLRVTGVASTDDPQAAVDAEAIWQRNRMDVRAPETHHQALLMGDAYALIWPNEQSEAVIWSLPAEQVVVSYDPDKPGVIRRAARLWQDSDGDLRWHLDLFYADRIERWISKQVPRSTQWMPTSYNMNSFVPWFEGCGLWTMWVGAPDAFTGSVTAGDVASVPNPYGTVPIVHFPNRRYHTYGISELANVVPLQDALNKAVCDMLVAMEFSAFPQRWATGIEVDGDPDAEGKEAVPPFEPGSDRIWAVAAPDAKFGDFRETNLQGYVEVQENLRSEIARVSGTPLHYLFITRGDFPSGEAMKSAEARFTRKVENRQQSFGNQWENLLALALSMERGEFVDPSVLSMKWESASPLALDTTEGEPVPTTVTATERI